MDDDSEEELKGFEDAQDEITSNHKFSEKDNTKITRKMRDSSEEDNDAAGAESMNTNTNKKRKTETGAIPKDKNKNKEKGKDNDKNKDDKEKQKDKDKKDKNEKRNEPGNWTKNKVYTTFFLEPIEKDDNTTLHPMEIARTLNKVGIKQYKELHRAGKARYKITFEKPQHAEAPINSKILKEDYKYKIFVPNMFKETIGVIRSVPPCLTETEISENIECGNRKLIKVERIKRKRTVNNKDELVDTYSVKLHFEGEKLPEIVKIYGIASKVEVYVFPLKICQKCWRFGHKEQACKASNYRCCKCSLEHNEKECKSKETTKCINCAGQHKADDKSCPERGRQYNIQREMCSNKLSFMEASKKFPRNNVQSRLNINDFPTLPGPPNPESPLIPQPQPQSQTQPLTQPQTQAHTLSQPTPLTAKETEELIRKVTTEVIKKLNITAIIQKIKDISETITTQTKNNNKQNAQELLTQIRKDLNSIIAMEENQTKTTDQIQT